MPIEVAFEGRVGSPPQAMTSNAGKDWKRFSLAVRVGGEDVEWISVAAFDAVADELPRDLGKGERVYVEGKLTVWRRDTPEGPKASLSVAATRILVLDRIGRRRRRTRLKLKEGETPGELSAAVAGGPQ